MPKLSIKEIYIENFKSFSSIRIKPDRNFNIIVGENNVGKTTIFEALQLWKKCYDLCTKSNDNSFYSNIRSSYISFSELYFLRITNDRELFNTTKRTTEITIIVCANNVDFILGFKITKPPSISNAFYSVKPTDNSELKEYADYLSEHNIKISKAIFIYQTRPISSVLAYEPIMNIGQISKKIKVGKSQEVLRNKIVTERTEKQIKELQSNIKSIVNYDFAFDFVNRSSTKVDEYIDLKIRVNGKSLDIHLQGSGFLQVAEIFSTITYVEAPLSILLVDEPDSHIHTTLQKPLISKLRSISQSQIFVISHNDNFVAEAKQGELFYLNSKAKINGKLESIELNNFDVVKKELGGTIIALERVNNCEKFVFVEGESDISHIKSLLEKYNIYSQNCLNKQSVTFFHQYGKDDFKQKLRSVSTVCKQLVGKKPWAVVYDKDFSTTISNKHFVQELKKILPKKSEFFFIMDIAWSLFCLRTVGYYQKFCIR